MKHFYLLFTLALLCACGGKNKSPDAPKGPSQQAYGVIISQSEMGASEWLLNTKQAEFFDEEQYVELVQPHLVFNKQGQEDSTVKADEGTYDMLKNLITLKGNVVGVSVKEGATIKAKQAYYDVARKTIWADSDVNVTRGGVTVSGKGFKASSDLSEIEIIKQETRLPAELGELKSAVRSYEK